MKTENLLFENNPIQDDLDIFEKKLRNIIVNYDNFLLEDISNFIFSNPKRLRPITVFLFSKILNINSPLVMKIALISELIHSASLIHDDILDEAELRRKNKTLYSKYGSKIAVLEGDLLLSSALELLAETNLEISKIYSKRIKLTIQGELKQNENLFNTQDENEYFKKTFNKTGNLFLAGLEALFSLGEYNKNLEDFIINYSMAFQLKNDIKGIKEDRNLGNYTLVMLYFLKDYKIEDFSKKNLDKYIKKANEKIEFYKANARKSLNFIEKTQYSEALSKLLDFI
ncbi:polyprenyl synthetase family protein [bacterium]|nr:polyprenyl synthetase family protein [bacterium]